MPEAEHFLYKHTIPSRVAKLERDVTRLKEGQTRQEDLLETIAASLVELHKKFDEQNARLTRVEQTMVTKFEFNQLLNQLDDKFASIEARLSKV